MPKKVFHLPVQEENSVATITLPSKPSLCGPGEQLGSLGSLKSMLGFFWFAQAMEIQ